MFLVQDNSQEREVRIRGFLSSEPAIAVILGAVHVEWTLRRAVLALGRTPNIELRERLQRCHGLDQYKQLWRDELCGPRGLPSLVHIVPSWPELRKAFELRHRLVHGASSCGADFAAPHVETLLLAAGEVRQFCQRQGLDLHTRLPIRRRK